MKLLIILVLISGFNVFSYSGCEESFNAFKKHVHPILVKSCSNCHGVDGIAVEHSSKNARKAFGFAQQYVSFPAIEGSFFYQLTKDKHWLEYEDNEGQGVSAQEMKSVLSMWNTGAQKCKDSSTYNGKNSTVELRSYAQEIPELTVSKKRDKFSLMRWDVSELVDFKAKVFFELEVQKTSSKFDKTPNSFRVRSPRVLTNKDLYLENIELITNGNIGHFGFSGIKKMIKGKPFSIKRIVSPFLKLSNYLPILIESNKKLSQISIGFGKLKLVSFPECSFSNSHISELKNTMKEAKCMNCHSKKTARAFRRWPLKENFCESYMETLHLNDFRKGLIFQKAILGRNGHVKAESTEALVKALKKGY